MFTIYTIISRQRQRRTASGTGGVMSVETPRERVRVEPAARPVGVRSRVRPAGRRTPFPSSGDVPFATSDDERHVVQRRDEASDGEEYRRSVEHEAVGLRVAERDAER